MKSKIKISLESHNPNTYPLGYAVCRQWEDNPHDVEVVEYAKTFVEANQIMRKLAKKDNRCVWFVGVYE